MTSDHDQARKWRRAMRQALPPTETALTTALKVMQARAPEHMAPETKDIIDAVTIEVLAESAAADGDLRRALEEALQRTFWSATSAPQAQTNALATGAGYAARVAQRVPDDVLRAAVYRSGLKLEGCLALRDAIAVDLDAVVKVLRSDPPDPEAHECLLHWLISTCVATLEELEELRKVDPSALEAALGAWVDGKIEADIERDHAEAWSAVKPKHLETLLVWALTGAFELIAALADDLQLREAAHHRLGPSRLRYGVFDAELCSLVRDGADRVQVVRVAAEYLREPKSPSASFWPLGVIVELRLAQEEAAKAAATSPDPRAEDGPAGPDGDQSAATS